MMVNKILDVATAYESTAYHNALSKYMQQSQGPYSCSLSSSREANRRAISARTVTHMYTMCVYKNRSLKCKAANMNLKTMM